MSLISNLNIYYFICMYLNKIKILLFFFRDNAIQLNVSSFYVYQPIFLKLNFTASVMCNSYCFLDSGYSC